ncbi:MAG: hypothetical protein VSS75_028050 [Candidatus Parabeggiatoa sp.]|nr:hypothetical protein [Candidatus Parabeggiatoa sp.]
MKPYSDLILYYKQSLSLSTEPQINRYFTAKRREASRLYNSLFRRDAMPRVSNYK